MSRYKEAKETLEKYDYSTKLELSEGIRNNITSGITVEQFFMMKETCIELLDKATPKKPPKHDKAVCPTCNSKANYGHPYTEYCCHCGQALDWSEE